ncbi:FxSxx-COOH system tetratricopeptide repeat protein [Nocardia sputorum]|uniref:FxSxx-COOH system tetratricopeptide repeat protein n=1 Tax=Nocardia sputorum TaxID=2984338 RepID=UPI0024907DFC|nr:FxSxx-COOH system tetratricopeptide repeat protein [Nocardia sputorum]
MVGSVPREPDHFVRREQLTDLEEGLAQGRVAVVVTGMRGAGKTQLAAAYARHVLDHEEGSVGWVNAETADTLHAGLSEIADYLGLSAPGEDTLRSARRLCNHLNNSSDRYLLVLDNATDPEQLRAVLPTRGGTRVLITTTNTAITWLADVTVDAGTGYTREQALAYLREATGLVDDPDGEQKLAKELGYLPLALSAAAAVITAARPPLSYETYLQRLRAQSLPRVLRRRDGADHPLRVDQAILLSIQAAEASRGDADLDSVVRWLLRLFAVLAPSGIRRELLHHPDPKLDELVDEAIDRGTQHSLLNWSTAKDRLLAHRLTARVLLERDRDADDCDDLLTSALAVLRPRLVQHEQAWVYRAVGADLVDQIEALWASGVPTHASPDVRDDAVACRFWAIRHLIETVSLDRAITIAEPFLAQCARAHGPNHPNTLTCRNHLANAYREAGRLAKAIPLYENNLTEVEHILGTDHPATLTSRNNLADAYRDAGRAAKAIPLYEKTLIDRERVLGVDHPATLTSRNNLASAYQLTGRVIEAISLLERNVVDRERVLGPDHPATLASRNHLAYAYRLAGRLTEAIPLYEKTLIDRERILGVDHPATLRTRNNLASAYQLTGRVIEAIPLAERNVIDRERVLSPDHPATLTSRNNLANAYHSAGRKVDAIPLLERNLTDSERILGPDHPTTLLFRNNLAAGYQSAGRTAEAIPLLGRNLTDAERILGPDHSTTLTTRNNLAAAYQSAGQTAKAIPLPEKTPVDRERPLGPDHPDTR